jgi:O-antigen/teichoic acid export membrane protein
MKNTMTTKFKTDLVANYISLIILAVCGLLFHMIIATQYGAATLGLFNLSMAIYVVASQFSVMGLHNAILHYVAIERAKASSYLIAALSLTILIALSLSLLIYSLRFALADLFDSPDLVIALKWIAGGLFFFSINKVLLSFFNGMERMKVYAVLQSTRYLTVLATILLFPKLGLHPTELTASFFLSEILVFVACLLFAKQNLIEGISQYKSSYLKYLFNFGSKSFLSGAFMELNIRLDVLAIGYLMNDYWVGVYSFAATFAEGFLQFFVVIKNQLNPYIAQLISQNQTSILQQKISHWRKYTYAFTALVAIGIYIFCSLYVHYMNLSSDFSASLNILAILLAGIWLSSGSHTFDTILLYGGQPFTYTKYILCMVIANLGLNFSLIPILSVEGAAIATVISYFVGAYVLYFYVKQKFQINYFMR